MIVVEKQLEAFKVWKEEFGELYRQLGAMTLNLSREQGTPDEESILFLSRLLETAKEWH